MRCAGTLPSIKNVRGRSPRPICVMTSSTCRHGAIHLRHTTTARLPNAPQIRTTTIQDTTMLFCSHLAGAAKPRTKAGRGCVGAPKTSRNRSRLHLIFRVTVSSESHPSAGFAPTPLLFSKLVAKTAHSFNRVAGFPEFFAQAPYMRVHGAGVDHTFVTPDVVKQFIAVLHAPAALD